MGAFLLLIALFAHFQGRRPPYVARKVWILFLAAGMLFFVWGACGGFYSIYLFTDRIRAHRSLDPAAVVAIEVLPGKFPEIRPPLAHQPLVFTDRQRIGQVIHALKAARPWAAAHPRVSWECILRLDDGTRKLSYTVSSTTNNGLLIAVESGRLLLGEYREDGLKEILEGIAREQGGAQEK
jgi:hypothetical protein